MGKHQFKILEKPAKVGDTVFEQGVPEFLVIQRAVLEYEKSVRDSTDQQAESEHNDRA